MLGIQDSRMREVVTKRREKRTEKKERGEREKKERESRESRSTVRGGPRRRRERQGDRYTTNTLEVIGVNVDII